MRVKLLSCLLFALSDVAANSYYVQIGAYQDPLNADLDNAVKLGELTQNAGSSGLTRIRVVNLSADDANSVLQRARESGYLDAFIGHSGTAQTSTTPNTAMEIPAYSGPSDRRLNAARAKVDPGQYGNIVFLDGKLMLKDGEEFKPLE